MSDANNDSDDSAPLDQTRSEGGDAVLRPPAHAMSQAPSARNNLSHWITHWAAIQPDALAWSDASTRVSYHEADERVGRLASWLERQGVGTGDRVALWTTNCVTTIEAFFAAARIGAIAFPVNARLTPAEIAFQLEDCRATLVLVDPLWRGASDQAVAFVSSAKPLLVETNDTFERDRLASPRRPESKALLAEDPAILMYTSGTTGKPKGALLPHRKALYNALNAKIFFQIEPADRVLIVAPLFHSLGLQILAIPAIYAGASLRLQEVFDAERVWRTIHEERISYVGGVPTMYQRLLTALREGRPFARPPASLRFAFTAGAAAPRELIEAFAEVGLLLKQGYGQTETSILTCLEAAQALRKAGSVGRPVEHAELRIVRSDTIDAPVAQWQDAQVGGVGEVVVRGPITMLGYWERPEANAETLREGGWLRTGDLATRDDDFDVTLVGRARELYISGGENVYPAEIEATLVEFPGLLEAAVIGIPDSEWGEVGRAHVVPEAGASLDISELQIWVAERLARFKLPREYVIERELPRTASGKVKKHRLRSRSDGGDV